MIIFIRFKHICCRSNELSTITRKCDENTLIIGDEICSGTETKSALTIMNAILDTLSKSNSSYLFATHFHELYENENFNVSSINGLVIKHLSVVYDPVNDCLVYDRKLKNGPGENFYGIG